jgi:hypothetical protein
VLLAVGLRVAGHLVVHGRGRTVAVSIHLSVSTDYVRVSTRAMIHQECAGTQSYLDVEFAHSTIDRRRDGDDSVDCYASTRSSRLDREYAERVDGETAQDASEMQLRRNAMTTHPDTALTITSSLPQYNHDTIKNKLFLYMLTLAILDTLYSRTLNILY